MVQTRKKSCTTTVKGVKYGEQLTKEQKSQFEELIAINEDVFQDADPLQPVVNNTECVINLKPGEKPVKCKGRRFSPKENEVIDNEVKDMLNKGVIEPSESAWSFPVVCSNSQVFERKYREKST